MAYIVHKFVDGEIEYLPDVAETEFFSEAELYRSRSLRLLCALYKAVEERENYYQINTPTAFGDPEFKLAYGIAHGIKIGAEIEEQERDGKLFFYKGKKLILVVEKPKLHRSHYEALKENARLLQAIGL